MNMIHFIQDDDVDVGASSDEDVSDNEFSTKKSASGGSKTKKPGFAFDFDNGDVSERNFSSDLSSSYCVHIYLEPIYQIGIREV